MKKLQSHILKKVIPSYALSLIIGAIVFGFMMKFTVLPDTHHPTTPSLQKIYHLLYSAILLCGITMMPLAITAIIFSEIYVWKKLRTYIVVSNIITLISFSTLIILIGGPPWILNLGSARSVSATQSLNLIESSTWLLVSLTATLSGWLYWFFPGKHAGRWKEASIS